MTPDENMTPATEGEYECFKVGLTIGCGCGAVIVLLVLALVLIALRW